MANKTSASKKARHDAAISKKRRRIKKELKQLVKKASAGNLPELQKKLDKAARKHLIHPNRASRLKSRLAKKYQPKPAHDRSKRHQSA